MRYILIYFLFLLPAHAEITREDITNIINKVDSYDIVPKSLIEHAKEEAKSLKKTDLKQINAASKTAETIQKEKLPATKTKKVSTQSAILARPLKIAYLAGSPFFRRLAVYPNQLCGIS